MQTSCPTGKRARGFTLVEVLVALAVLAILVSVAYPSYLDYLKRGRRAEAQQVMTDAAQFMERFYAANQRYDRALDGSQTDDAERLPLALRGSPRGGAQTLYNIDVSTALKSYTLRATPAGSMADDVCGTLTLTHDGQRGLTGSARLQDCWPS